ncbi:hypothetical protein ACET3Z_012137 [Daucus carota]
MKTSTHLVINIVMCCIVLSHPVTPTRSNHTEIKVGLLLDLNSSLGKMMESCMRMAHFDFYKSHPHYRTRLLFRTKNSHGILDAASGALELLNNDEVRAILGPQTTPEAKFVVELGAKTQVPIVSFSATSSSLSPARSPYFIQMAGSDSCQSKAMAAIVEGYGWQEVVIVYEDNGYHDEFIRNLSDAIRKAGIQILLTSAVSLSSNDSQILDEVYKLKTVSARVFLVHMASLLGSRFFVHAKTAGMMSEGYAWLITDGLSNLLGSMDATVIDAMQGVLGLRPYVSKSKDLTTFRERWERKSQYTKPKAELNIYALWAYDAVWALAMALERIGPINFKETEQHNAQNMNDLSSSIAGPVLLKEILSTRFKGLSGDFNLVNGQLQISTFEILHVIGKGERRIGYWTANRGLSRYPDSVGRSSKYSTSVNVLRSVIWPGDSTVKPMYWAVPSSGKRLRVGIPVKEGFTEFVKLKEFHNSKEYNVTGFCADLFRELLVRLPFKIDNPQYIPFGDPTTGKSAGSYDDLLTQLEEKKYDIVVADVTILAERAQRVDFSTPYLGSEVVMLRQVKYDGVNYMWIFLKPFSSDLWLTIAISCIFMGAVVRTLEHRANTQRQFGMLVWFPLASLVFPERNMVASKWSKFVLVIWLFTAYIVMQSYTANLSSNLTVSRLQRPTDKLYCIGFQEGSFVKEMLTKRLDFNVSRIKSYASVKQYHDALSKGCHNGGVDAILDELPYIKIFLDTYGETNYILQGSSYKTGGLGFAFPKGSALAPHISMALLNLTGSGEMHAILSKNFGPEYSDSDYSFNSASHVSSIGTKSLAGLFIISGTMALFALLFSAPWFQQRFSDVSTRYKQSCVFPSPPSDVIELSVHSALDIRVDLTTTAVTENSFTMPNQSDENGHTGIAISEDDINLNEA